MTVRQLWGPDHRRRRPARRAGPAQAAFDLLHLRHATPFTRQAYLLSGHPEIAERAVAHAFRTAWERWPEVANDRDPAGWVRAAAHDYALSPWHTLVPGRLSCPVHPGPPADRALLAGLLALPRPYRRCLLLHDGLGLGLAATAAETEASTAATRGRLEHARELLTTRVPELSGARAERRVPLLTDRLRLLLAAAHVGPPPPAAEVREGCERASRRRTGAAYGLTALVTAVVAAALLAPSERWAEPAPQDARNGGGAPPAAPAAPAPAPGVLPGVAPGVLPSAVPGVLPPAVPGARPEGVRRDGEGVAYLPEVRSGNYRVRLVERGGHAAVEPVDGGRTR
jgi:DNA-directed RNA polymerase specialized sigma24 family protein